MAARGVTRVGIALAAGAAVLAAGACSSSEEPAAPEGGADNSAESGTGTAGPAPTVTIDGVDVGGSFEQQKCEWEHDEGHRQLEYTAESGADQLELDVEIVLADPPQVDDFSLETDEDEWKASKADRGQAQVSINGDEYTVSSWVSEGRGPRTSNLEATFTCSDG